MNAEKGRKVFFSVTKATTGNEIRPRVSPFHPFTFPLVLFALLWLISSCAAPKLNNERIKLRRELLKWESFDSQGVVEISFMGLALRKMFSASKNRGQLRLDVFDGGIMGAGASPMLSFYSGDYVALKSPYLPILEALDPQELFPTENFALFSSADSLLSRFGDTIIRNKKMEIDSLQISFKSDYRLERVFDPTSLSELRPVYGTNGSLQELWLKSSNNMSIRLIFDKISYIQPEIIPLPKAAVALDPATLKALENLDMMQIIKNYLNKK